MKKIDFAIILAIITMITLLDMDKNSTKAIITGAVIGWWATRRFS